MADPTLPYRPFAKTIARTDAFFAALPGTLAAAMVALLAASAALLSLPVALRQLIDHGLAAKDAATINRYFLGFLAAAVLYGIFAALRFYLVTWLGERVVADLRSAVYRRVVGMDPTFYETTRIGEVLSRLTADTTLVQAIAGVNLSIVLRSTLSLAGALVMLALTSAKLTGVIVVMIPLGRRTADPDRPARPRPVARIAGPDRGCERTRRRDLERDPDGAGVHVGAPAGRPLSAGGRGQLRRGRQAHARAGLADGNRHHARVRRHHLGVVDRRARRARGRDDRRRARTVPAVRGPRRHSAAR